MNLGRKAIAAPLPGAFLALLLSLLAARVSPLEAARLTGLAALRVPPGFRVETVAAPDLVAYPMMGTLDERGRLFVCESSGNNKVTNAQMAANPNFRVRLLEDTNGDGVYDRSTVFADKLTLPAGAVWYRGSLYVASPPDLFRFTDTDGDGVADRREVVMTGWNLSSNAASLHGPFLGPDGWLYLTDGRHGYKIRTQEGELLEGQASRLWRLRPEGAGLEWISGGGFDNPVELVFTPAGEVIGTMTYFTDPKDGQRDALLHFVEGGVYPKWHPVVSEFKRTGELMPVMTKFARIAPSGLLRYRGTALGPGFHGNLFSAQFNPHRLQRHILFRQDATFRTADSDFLTSTDPDFHPTDVIEDADGSLLVIDTGAWFIHGCPISRVAKPEVKGAIYRIRRSRSARVEDPRGQALDFARMATAQLAGLLSDSRFVVRDRALDALVDAGDAAVSELAAVRAGAAPPEVRCAAVFGLARIGTPKALEAVRAALDDADMQIRVAAARSAGMAKDHAALDQLMRMVERDQAAGRRQAAAALGQIGERRATAALLRAASARADRFVEHSIIYSLILLRDADAVAEALNRADGRTRKAALIALDQMDGSPLRPEHLRPFLASTDKELRGAALWVAAHHPAWSGEMLTFLRSRLTAPAALPAEDQAVSEVLRSFCGDTDVQKLAGEFLVPGALPAARQLLLLQTVAGCSLPEFPAAWVEPTGRLLASADERLVQRAIALIQLAGVSQLDDGLERIANNRRASDELRTAALGVLVTRHPHVPAAQFEFLLRCLLPGRDAALRLGAAQVLGQARLSDAQLSTLAARYLPQADPLTLPSLLGAFATSRSEKAGLALVAALLKAPDLLGDSMGKQFDEMLKGFPPAVREAAKPLVARVSEQQRLRAERLQKLEPLLTGGGDPARGRRIFFGAQAGCSKCHTMGTQGGHVGPDLTGIGAIRSGHDLLEAVVFPGASFVPGFEVYRVETADTMQSGLITQRTPESIVLLTGPGGEVRIPRKKVVSMKPSPVSLMPEGFDRTLTPTQFRDLLAFLQSQKSRESAQAANRR